MDLSLLMLKQRELEELKARAVENNDDIVIKMVDAQIQHITNEVSRFNEFTEYLIEWSKDYQNDNTL
jgi:hypothetical protein